MQAPPRSARSVLPIGFEAGLRGHLKTGHHAACVAATLAYSLFGCSWDAPLWNGSDGGSQGHSVLDGSLGVGAKCPLPAPACCASSGLSASATCDSEGWVCPAGAAVPVMIDGSPACPAFCADPEPVCCQNRQTQPATCNVKSGTWTCAPDWMQLPHASSCPLTCDATHPCPDGSWCDYPDNLCGAGAKTGECAAKPSACPNQGPQVCGCQGTVYPNECTASQDGVDVASTGACQVPNGAFPCGYKLCVQAADFCVRSRRSFGSDDEYQCVATPACTNASTCVCLTGQACPNAVGCSLDQSYSTYTVTCPEATP